MDGKKHRNSAQQGRRKTKEGMHGEVNSTKKLYRIPPGLCAEIEKMLELRQEHKKNKQFALADKIRDDLLQKGIAIADNSQNTTWSFLKK